MQIFVLYFYYGDDVIVDPMVESSEAICLIMQSYRLSQKRHTRMVDVLNCDVYTSFFFLEHPVYYLQIVNQFKLYNGN